jgi:hypothetical protein
LGFHSRLIRFASVICALVIFLVTISRVFAAAAIPAHLVSFNNRARHASAQVLERVKVERIRQHEIPPMTNDQSR